MNIWSCFSELHERPATTLQTASSVSRPTPLSEQKAIIIQLIQLEQYSTATPSWFYHDKEKGPKLFCCILSLPAFLPPMQDLCVLSCESKLSAMMTILWAIPFTGRFVSNQRADFFDWHINYPMEAPFSGGRWVLTIANLLSLSKHIVHIVYTHLFGICSRLLKCIQKYS